MSKLSCRTVIVCLVFALGVGAPSAAQEAAEDDVGEDVARLGLEAPPSLRKAKRRLAKREGWALTGVGSLAAGYDSNIFKGPGDTTGSAVFDLGAKVEGLAYLTKRDRIKLSVESTNRPFSASDKVDEYIQELDVFYSHRIPKRASLTFSGEIKHANDAATASDGDKFTRDFENMVYRGRAGTRLKFADDHVLRVSYAFKRKDYFETSGLDSLDWWRHGPRAGYQYEVNDSVTLKARYDFQHQRYDVEEASNRAGSEAGSNPDEEHFFHTARAGAEWKIIDDIVVEAELRFRNKDDRHRDFESYDDYQGEFAISYFPIDRLRIEASTKISHRNFENRPENVTTNSGELEYDRYRASFKTRYELSEHLAMWGLYGLDVRDTNRSAGTSYRSYDQHTFFVGVTAAY